MRYLSGKEKKNLLGKLPKGYTIDKKDELKEFDSILYKGDEKFLIIDGSGIFLPHLKSIPLDEYNSVYVDRGAIPFIIKGADLMRPGIEIIEDGIMKGDVVMVRDSTHKKVLALGYSLFSSDEMRSMSGGKVIKIYHYTGDKYY